MDPTKPYRTLILYPHVGYGKSLSLLTPVYTSKDEYKLMGDLKVGDKVLTPSGDQSEIIAIHPQGVIDTYELEFDEGTKILCSKEHIWHVSYRKNLEGHKIWENVTTEFLINNMDKFEFEIPKIEVNSITILNN